MKHDVWMPLYVGDYLSDTMHLTCEQSGAYLHLLMHYWRNGPPPLDDAVLCSITRLKTARFRMHKNALLSFFQIEGGRLRHSRADAEINKAKQNAERRSTKASKAAQARWEGAKEDAPSIAPGNATSNASECPLPSPSFPKGKAKDDPKKALFDNGLALLVGAGVSEGSARGYLGKLRKDFGDDALSTALAAAAALDPPPSEPKAWLQGALRKQANDGAGLLDSINRKYGSKETASAA